VACLIKKAFDTGELALRRQYCQSAQITLAHFLPSQVTLLLACFDALKLSSIDLIDM